MAARSDSSRAIAGLLAQQPISTHPHNWSSSSRFRMTTEERASTSCALSVGRFGSHEPKRAVGCPERRRRSSIRRVQRNARVHSVSAPISKALDDGDRYRWMTRRGQPEALRKIENCGFVSWRPHGDHSRKMRARPCSSKLVEIPRSPPCRPRLSLLGSERHDPDPACVHPGATLCALSTSPRAVTSILHPDEAGEMEQVYWYCFRRKCGECFMA